jgi:hypothetical protein
MEGNQIKHLEACVIEPLRHKSHFKFRLSSTKSWKRYLPCPRNSVFFIYKIFVEGYSQLEKSLSL